MKHCIIEIDCTNVSSAALLCSQDLTGLLKCWRNLLLACAAEDYFLKPCLICKPTL